MRLVSDVGRDLWIWCKLVKELLCRAGDIAYTDWPDVNCAANPSHVHCNCTRDWLRSNPDSCLAGGSANLCLANLVLVRWESGCRRNRTSIFFSGVLRSSLMVLFSLTKDGFTGDVAHARLKFEEQLSNLDYMKVRDLPLLLYCRCTLTCHIRVGHIIQVIQMLHWIVNCVEQNFLL